MPGPGCYLVHRPPCLGSTPASRLAETMGRATLRQSRRRTSISEPIAETGIREGVSVRCAEEGQVARWRGINDPLQVRVHGNGELRLRLMLHDGQEPLSDMLSTKADDVATALETVEQECKG